MTTTKTLKAEKRDGRGKGFARKLRQSGRLPGVLYGKDMESVAISLDHTEVEHLFKSISVENTIVELDIEGDDAPHQTLVREIQSHPYKYELVHVDFLRIQAGVAVDVEVPVHLIGTPVGVKQHGGNLEQIIHELPMRCIPSLIPEVIEVDVSHLDLEESIHIYDLTFPEGVEVTIDEQRTVCNVAVPRAEEVSETEEGELLEGAVAGEAAEPEVIGGADSDDSAGEGEG